MAITDPHDPNRTFRRYVVFNLDGTVASVHDFEAGTICPLPAAIEVTDLVPVDLDAIQITPDQVTAIQAAVDDHAKQLAAIDQAKSDAEASAAALALVQATTRGAVSVAIGKVQLGQNAPPSPIVANG